MNPCSMQLQRCIILLLALLHVSDSAGESSCRDRCRLIEPGASCQCTSWCLKFGGCCSDYHEFCVRQEQFIEPKVLTLPPILPTKTTTQVTRTSVTITSTTVSTVTSTTVTTVTATSVTTTSILTTSGFRGLPRLRIKGLETANRVGDWTCPGFENEVQFQVGTQSRRMFLYLPRGGENIPLWLVLHGTNNKVQDFLRYSGLNTFAKENNFGLLALQALPNMALGSKQYQFNVGIHGQAMPDDDVHDLQFVKESLHEILKLPCIDKRRVHCTGYSNGARFCMRLASELSQVIASVAPVSGLRFPTPNQAIRPIPILAFHGDLDQVNPWNGHGEGYWQSSVPDAMQDWARFNGCRLASGAAPAAPQFIEAGSYAVASYSDCNGNATVELLLLHGAGHQWPGAMWPLPGREQCAGTANNKSRFRNQRRELEAESCD